MTTTPIRAMSAPAWSACPARLRCRVSCRTRTGAAQAWDSLPISRRTSPAGSVTTVASPIRASASTVSTSVPSCASDRPVRCNKKPRVAGRAVFSFPGPKDSVLLAEALELRLGLVVQRLGVGIGQARGLAPGDLLVQHQHAVVAPANLHRGGRRRVSLRHLFLHDHPRQRIAVRILGLGEALVRLIELLDDEFDAVLVTENLP